MDQMLLGTLLGDGSLSYPTRSSVTPRYVTNHSSKQLEYVMEKLARLRKFGAKRVEVLPNPGKGSEWARVVSGCREELIPYFRLFYRNGKKELRSEVLEMLTAEGLAWWWMDDGHVGSGGSSGSLATNGFTLAETGMIADWFQQKWGIVTVVEMEKRSGTPQLRFRASGVEKLSRIIEDFVFASMRYKLVSPRDAMCAICGKVFTPKKTGLSRPCCSSVCKKARKKQYDSSRSAASRR